MKIGTPTFFAVFLAFPAAILADDTHYQDFVLGGRAVGLGGAYTAIADDPSGLLYNPAGLVDVRHESLQIGTNLYGIEKGSTGTGFREVLPNVRDLGTSFKDLNIIPNSVGAVKAFLTGEEGADAENAVGFGLFVPAFRSFATTEEYREGDVKTGYRRKLRDRSFWAGVGYARRLSDDISLGLSLFYVLRGFDNFEECSFAQDWNPKDKSFRTFRTLTSELKFYNGSLTALAGAKYYVSTKLQVGLLASTPSVGLNSTGSLRVTRSWAAPDEGTKSYFSQNEYLEIESQTRINFMGRAGAAYIEPRLFTLAADLSFNAPVKYRLLKIRGLNEQSLVPVFTEVERAAVLNLNVGGEYLIFKTFSVAGGFFTDFSSAGDILVDDQGRLLDNKDHLPDIDLYGLSVALGFFGKYTLTRVGVMYTFGNGSDVVPKDTTELVDPEKISFQKVHLSHSFLYVFMSSTFRY